MRFFMKTLLPLGLIFLLILSGCSKKQEAAAPNSAGNSDNPAAVTEPEVLVTPDAVREIATDYVAAFYQSTTDTPGYFPRENGIYQVQTTEELVFDDWRVDEVAAVYQDKQDLVGYPFGVYRLDFSFRTTSPNAVLEAEPAAIVDAEGWFSPSLSCPLYLICTEYEGTYLTLVAISTQIKPEEEAFSATIADALADIYAEGLSPRAKFAALLAGDEPVYFWQVSADGRISDAIPADSTLSPQVESFLPKVFDCPWAEATEGYKIPTTASICIGLGSDTGTGSKQYFQFYLDSNLVFWHEEGQTTAWHAGDVEEALSEQISYLLVGD